LQNARQLLTDKAEKDGDYYNMRMSHCIKLWGMMEIKITGLFKPL
jgi:hypothetical protein